VPSYYSQLSSQISDSIEYFNRLHIETLFFIFYYVEVCVLGIQSSDIFLGEARGVPHIILFVRFSLHGASESFSLLLLIISEFTCSVLVLRNEI